MSRTSLALLVALFLVPTTDAKDKNKKPVLSADVLRAQTVCVVIRPDAGEPINDPSANRRAQEAVEQALEKWGRFRLVMQPNLADLVIAVRKGTGRLVNPTIANSPIDNRPVIFAPDGSDNTRIGAQHGQPPGVNQPGMGQPNDPRPQTEIGSSDDSFEVYRGGVDDPLGASPVWRYSRNDALRPPDVPAVEQLRKVMDESEKAIAQNAQKKKP